VGDKNAPFGFRAPESLVTGAKEKAATEGHSLADVTRAILVNFVVAPELGIDLSGADGSKLVPLPSDAAIFLDSLYREVQDPDVSANSETNVRFNAYLAALHEAGWSLDAIGQPLGMTRQAVFQRVKRAHQNDPVEGLPEVPLRSPHRRSKGRGEKTAFFSVRLDQALREAVSERARREGASVSTLVTEGLAAYIEGSLVVAGKG
jgi:hypothetical protein